MSSNTDPTRAASRAPVAISHEMLTVREAARRTSRSPETIRRWIRGRRLRASKAGARYSIEEAELAALVSTSETLSVPAGWQATVSGRPMPNVVAAVRRSRAGR
jgi:excisionase family DNA binding protein